MIGVILFDYLTYACKPLVVFHLFQLFKLKQNKILDFSTIEISMEPSASCLLTASLCSITASDPFLFSVACWATLQLSWTIILLASQLWQISRQMTTFEVSNLGRYGFMGGRGSTSLGSQMGHRHQHQQFGDSEGSGETSGHDHSHPHKHKLGGCGTGFLMQLTGLDVFTKGRAADGLARAGKATNPFDVGIVSNCKDFWTSGRELGVEYERLYNVPAEGFQEAKLRKMREDEDDIHAGTDRRKKKGLFMGINLGIGRSNREGYEPVNQV